jgi:hypothetical protein
VSAEGQELTVESFVRIRTFILEQGHRQTYCNMFNHNPHWAFPGFDAYLNPPDQRNINCEPGRSEFNRLVIQTNGRGGQRYWDVTLDPEKKALRLEQHYERVDEKTLAAEVGGFFARALAEIERIASPRP